MMQDKPSTDCYQDYEDRQILRNTLEEVHTEQLRQITKWGVQNHSPIEWMAILTEEVGEAAKAAQEAHFAGKYYDVDKAERLANYREECIQIAAVAASMANSIDRYNLVQKYVNNQSDKND